MTTREERIQHIMKLEGLELDSAIAEAQGWTGLAICKNAEVLGSPPGGSPGVPYKVAFFHAEIDKAWDLVEKMVEPEIWREEDGKWRVRSLTEIDGNEWVEASIASTAIAKAYLIAMLDV